MSLPPGPFFMDGPCEDWGYRNTRDHPRGAQAKSFVETLWERFYPLADSHFRVDARNHFLQRFWEMYFAAALQEKGFNLQRHGNEGPEFYAFAGNRRIWFEAIAPDPGTGPDQVPELVHGEAGEVPTEKILLRFTNALDTKRKRYVAALAKEIVSPNDQYVLAINSRGIPHASYGNTMPYFIQAFLPVGPLTVVFDKITGKVIDTFYQYRSEVSKLSGNSVSTRAFLDEEVSFCSAVLHSSVDCANHPDQLGSDFSVLHNPKAQHPFDNNVFKWWEQFTFHDGRLRRLPPNP
jgi:hypothetical protein